jgi:hypothetical protein
MEFDKHLFISARVGLDAPLCQCGMLHQGSPGIL